MIRVSQPLIGPEEHTAAAAALERAYFGHAELVVALEEAIATYLPAAHVVCVANGTAALHLALLAAGVGPSDEVLVPSLTFVACFQAIAATGARPVACDVEPDTLRLDVDDAKRRLTPRTKAVMPVHYAGGGCRMEEIADLAAGAGLRVVEDAAHAFGSTWKGRRVGSSGDLVCFSFDSIKTITCGEGGAVVCADADAAERIRRMRLLGMVRPSHASTSWKERTWMFEVDGPGFRYHMSNLNAAIGLVQLAKVDAFVARRREICRRYDDAFRDLRGIAPLELDLSEAAPHVYVVRVAGGRRDALAASLRERDIETSINYVPNHLHAAFREDGLQLPETERAFDEILTLPLHCAMSDDDVDAVIEGVRIFL